MKDPYCFIFSAAQKKPFFAGTGLNLIDIISNIHLTLELAVEGIDENLSGTGKNKQRVPVTGNRYVEGLRIQLENFLNVPFDTSMAFDGQERNNKQSQHNINNISSFHIGTILLFERLRVQGLRFGIATIPTFFTTLNVER
jgi:UDP-N-acetylglucosamine 2-epimerase